MAEMKNRIIANLIKKEKQLLDKIDSPEALIDLIDEEFIEIGKSATFYNKSDVANWLNSPAPSEQTGASFKGQFLSDDVVLLTYVSSINTPNADRKKAIRSSIWRLKQSHWKMIFHQGTPLP